MIEEELFRQLFFFLRQCLWLMQVVTSAGGVAARGLVNGRGPRWKRGRDLLPALVTTCNHIPDPTRGNIFISPRRHTCGWIKWISA